MLRFGERQDITSCIDSWDLMVLQEAHCKVVSGVTRCTSTGDVRTLLYTQGICGVNICQDIEPRYFQMHSHWKRYDFTKCTSIPMHVEEDSIILDAKALGNI